MCWCLSVINVMDVYRPVRLRSEEISAGSRIFSLFYYSCEAVGIWKMMYSNSAVARIICFNYYINLIWGAGKACSVQRLSYGLADPVFEYPTGARYIYIYFFFFSFLKIFGPALGFNQLPIQLASGTLSLKVKRPWREANHSPFNADIKNERSYIISPSARLHSVCSDSCTYTMSDVREFVFTLSTVCLTDWKYGHWQ